MADQPGKVRVRTTAHAPLLVDGAEVLATLISFAGLTSGREHLAIRLGRPERVGAPLVRVHSECLTGDVFASLRCDCGPQLDESIRILTCESGYLLYMRQEGRGVGLYNKLDAYVLQGTGLDTFEANRAIGRAADERDYGEAAAMLRALDIQNVDLLTNNPDKVRQLRTYGVGVRSVVPTRSSANKHNLRYLRAKRDVANHSLKLAEAAETGT